MAPLLGIAFRKNAGFPDRMRGVIEALDFTIENHPEAAAINAAIADLLKGIVDTAAALAKLSNIPNMRHGGSLDWGTLERQHAVMLGGLCDALVSFLFDIAWTRRTATQAEPETTRYEDFQAFNDLLDDEYEEVEIAGSIFLPSKIFYSLDATSYEAARKEWEAEQAADKAPEQAAADRALPEDITPTPGTRDEARA